MPITMEEIKNWEANSLKIIEQMGSSRELSIAKTHFENSVLWIQKHFKGE